MIDLPEDGLTKSPAMLVRLDSLAQKAEGYKLTKRTTTVLNILKDLNQTLHEGDAAYYRIPTNPEEGHNCCSFTRMQAVAKRNIGSITTIDVCA